MARKWECQNLLNCHLAISCSWIDYHTSSERGDSGVSADSKKFWIFHTNGYFQAYFWVALGSTKLHPQLGLSLSHFFSDIRLPYPHLKRIPRAFIWTQMLENIFSNKRARAWGNLYVGNPSYFFHFQTAVQPSVSGQRRRTAIDSSVAPEEVYALTIST